MLQGPLCGRSGPCGSRACYGEGCERASAGPRSGASLGEACEARQESGPPEKSEDGAEMGYNDRGHKAIPSWSVGLVRGPPKSSLTSPVCCLTLRAGEPSPAFCPTDFTPAYQQPPRRVRAKASCVSGVVFVTLQDGHTLHERRDKKQTCKANTDERHHPREVCARAVACLAWRRSLARSRSHARQR